MAATYDPSRTYEVDTFDLEYRKGDAPWARIYQPRGEGPFPALLDLHGGAWNNGDRTSNGVVDEALAASGMVVAAIDLRLAPEYAYPASIQDANYGTRWLKAKAGELKADPSRVGAFGSSSGGHVVELSALRPRDPRYTALPLPEASEVDATLAYAIMRSPVTDPYLRYVQAEKMGRTEPLQSTRNYFVPWESIFEGNPPRVVERGDAEELPPMLILAGADDDNVPPEIQEGFAAAYQKAGGELKLEVIPNAGHMLAPGWHTERVIELAKAFIAQQLAK